MRKGIFVAGFITLSHGILKFWGMNHDFSMLLEFLLQGWAPWIFIACLKYMPTADEPKWLQADKALIFWIRLALSTCFIGHGAYAAGFPYQPINFVNMIAFSFPISFEAAQPIVTFIGWMDIVLGITIFIRPLERATLYHMAVWGFITACARVTAYVIVPMEMDAFNFWFYETTVRLIHGALPLFLLFLFKYVQHPDPYPMRQEVKEWFQHSRWSAIGAISGTCLLFSYMPLHPDFDQATGVQQQRIEAEVHPIPEKVDPALFKKSSSGKWYCDHLFQTEGFPIRFQFKAREDQFDDVLEKLSVTFLSNQQIIQALRQAIILNYRDPKNNASIRDYDEQRILNFVTKTVMTYKKDGTLSARVYAPWLDSRTFEVPLTPPNISE